MDHDHIAGEYRFLGRLIDREQVGRDLHLLLGENRMGQQCQGQSQKEALHHGVSIAVSRAPGVSGRVTVARVNVQISVAAS
ncbi:hypothetical protein D3C86_1960920 [compost metagenome]